MAAGAAAAGARLLRGGPDRLCALPGGAGGRARCARGRSEQDAARGRRSGQDRPQGRRAAGAAAARRPAEGGRGAQREPGGGPPSLARARAGARRSDALRHRVSKLLLLHGRVYPEPSTWTQRHRQWLAAQRFEQPASRARLPRRLAAVDGLVARKAALEERLSRLALEDEWWPTVARLRCFRGIDTLSALALCLEIGDFARFQRPAQLAAWLGLVPTLQPVRRVEQPGLDHQDRLRLRPPPPRRGGLALPARAAHRRHAPQPPAGPARPRPPDRLARPAPPPPSPATATRTRQAGNVATVAAARELACFLWAAAVAELTPTTSPPARAGAGPTLPARATLLWAARTRPRPLLDSARRRRTRALG